METNIHVHACMCLIIREVCYKFAENDLNVANIDHVPVWRVISLHEQSGHDTWGYFTTAIKINFTTTYGGYVCWSSGECMANCVGVWILIDTITICNGFHCNKSLIFVNLIERLLPYICRWTLNQNWTSTVHRLAHCVVRQCDRCNRVWALFAEWITRNSWPLGPPVQMMTGTPPVQGGWGSCCANIALCPASNFVWRAPITSTIILCINI